MRRRRRKSGTTDLLNVCFLPGIMYNSSSGPIPLVSNSHKSCEVDSIMDPISGEKKKNSFKVAVSELSSLYNRLIIEPSQSQGVWSWNVYTLPLYCIKARMLILGRIKEGFMKEVVFVMLLKMNRISSGENGPGRPTKGEEAWAKIQKGRSPRRRSSGLYRGNSVCEEGIGIKG